MKRHRLIIACLLALVVQASFASDRVLNIPLADVLAMPEAQSELGGVKFYLAGTATPVVNRRILIATINRKTNAFNKSDEFACKWVALSVLRELQAKAVELGANAVVDIVSDYKQIETKSNSTIVCRAGAFTAGVALKGSIAVVDK